MRILIGGARRMGLSSIFGIRQTFGRRAIHHSVPNTQAPVLESIPEIAPVLDNIPKELISNVTPVLDSIPKELIPEIAPVLDKITAIGDMATLGLCSNYPVGLVQQFLEVVYVNSGLPWWATIAASTVAIRFLLLPFSIKGQRAAVKLHNAKPEIDPIKDEMTRLKSIGDKPGAHAQAVKLQKVFKQHQINPFGILWNFAQFPAAVSLYLGIQKMVEKGVPGLSTEGALWFKDLTIADPTYMLPAVAALSVIGSIEISSRLGAGDAVDNTTTKNAIRIACLIGIPLMSWLPPAVFIYMMANVAAGLIQAAVLGNKRIAGMLNLPIKDQIVTAPKSMFAVNQLSDAQVNRALKSLK